MPTVTKTTTVDMWVGTTTRTTTVDMLLQRSPIIVTNVDMYVYKGLSTTVDMFVVDPQGSFRGTMTATQRDALGALQPGDTVIVTDDGFRLEHQYYTGSAWIKAQHIQAPERGVE